MENMWIFVLWVVSVMSVLGTAFLLWKIWDKKQTKRQSPQKGILAQYIGSGIIYLFILILGFLNTQDNGIDWRIIASVFVVCHIFLSIVIIRERELGALFFLGKPIADISSGPHFAFWPAVYVRRETRNIIQIEIGVLTPEERQKAEALKSSESVYLFEDPFYVNWGDIDSAENVTEKEIKRFKDNPYAKPLVTATHLTIRFEIFSLTSLIMKAGDLNSAIELIRKVATSTLISYAGKSFVGRALSQMDQVDEMLKTTIENFVVDPGSERYQKKPEHSWGVNIRRSQITRMGTAKRLSKAMANRGKAIYDAQAEKFRLAETAAGEAEAIKLKAEADKIRLEKEGAGRAEAERLLFVARKRGIKELAKALETEEGKLALQLETLQTGLKEGKAIILPIELQKLAGALSNFVSPSS
ncbi:MAG: hypothetical protein JW740_01440 [Candidatus Zambryskibacteria bacterium]|nr:hypothetical protein [Candidatus Zambryskibacteria bacterium]